MPTIMTNRVLQSRNSSLVSSVKEVSSFSFEQALRCSQYEKAYQKEMSLSFCLASIRKLASVLLPECNSLQVSQDSCVEASQLP